jgi:hypothetical protein
LLTIPDATSVRRTSIARGGGGAGTRLIITSTLGGSLLTY